MGKQKGMPEGKRMKGVFFFGIFWCMIREKNREEDVP